MITGLLNFSIKKDAEASNQQLYSEHLEFYLNGMHKLLNQSDSYLNQTEFREAHEKMELESLSKV